MLCCSELHNGRLAEMYYDEMTYNGEFNHPTFARIANAIAGSKVSIFRFFKKEGSLKGLKIKGIGKETKKILEFLIKDDWEALKEFRIRKARKTQEKKYRRVSMAIDIVRKKFPSAKIIGPMIIL